MVLWVSLVGVGVTMGVAAVVVFGSNRPGPTPAAPPPAAAVTAPLTTETSAQDPTSEVEPTPEATRRDAYGEAEVNRTIPDDDYDGVTDTIRLDGPGDVDTIAVDIYFSHDFSCDLVIELRSPDGTIATLADEDLDCDAGLLSLSSGDGDEELDPLLGEPIDGEWDLTILDLAPADTGVLESWEIAVEGS